MHTKKISFFIIMALLFYTGKLSGITDLPSYDDYSEYKDIPSLKSLAKSIIRKELRSLKDPEKYYTYYHAQQWGADLPQRIYAELYPSKNKEFFPLHFLT